MRTQFQSAPGVMTVVDLSHDGELTTGTIQDCTPIREYAQAAHKEGFHGSREMKHAAKLPAVAVETYCNVNRITFAEFMQNPVHVKAMCNDPALKDFRIWPGKL